MKVGQTFPVIVQGIVVATAVVEHIDGEQVTVVFPATRFVARTRTELTDEGPEPKGTEHIIDGVDRPAQSNPVTDATASGGMVTSESGPLSVDKPETKAETVEAKTDATEAVNNG